MSYTKLPSDLNKKTYMRNRLKSSMDGFSCFTFNTHNMFDEFGVFIISNKQGDLKIYNGPNYSNKYVKPEFSTQNILTGIEFDVQKISFKVGVYYFDMEEYQKLLNLLNPYEITNLIFNFEPNWQYLVKPTAIKDSPRYIIDSCNGKNYYYTELDLTFEIQGEPCLYSTTVTTLKGHTVNDFHEIEVIEEGKLATEKKPEWKTISNLDIPVKLEMTFNNDEENSFINQIFTCKCIYKFSNLDAEEFDLFSFKIVDDSFKNNKITFNSEQGILLKIIDNTTMNPIDILLPNQSAYLVNAITVNKFLIPGAFTLSQYKVNGIAQNDIQLDSLKFQFSPNFLKEVSCEIQGRTNTI